MERINNLLITLVEKGKAPSVQYLLFDRDQILHEFGAGFTDVINRKQSEKYTVYKGFSVTKTFTALAVLQLAEKGKVDLDQSAKGYLEDFNYSEEITVRQLLGHTAGIPNPNPLSWIHPAAKHDSFSGDLFFNQIFEKHPKVKSQPGKKFAYSNLGYVYLGRLVESVSGMGYEEYVQKNIIEPLELEPSDLGFEYIDSALYAKGYHKKNSLLNWIMGLFIDKKVYRGKPEGKWQPFLPYYVNGASYGGLMGSPVGFMKYVQELLKDDSKLLSPGFKNQMFTENQTLDHQPTGMSLSWFIGKLNDQRYCAHAGGGGGFYCEIRLYPEKGIGSIIMFNRSGMTNESFLDKLDKFYFESRSPS